MSSPRRCLAASFVLLICLGLGLNSTLAAASGGPTPDTPIVQLAPSGADRALALAYSPDGRWLGVGASFGVYVFDTQTQTQRLFLPAETWVRSVAFSPDGQLLAAGVFDGTVRLWQAKDGRLLHRLVGHSGGVRSVAFSADGRVLASAADDNTVRLWDAQRGVLLHHLDQGLAGVRALAFSSDGRWLATAGYDNAVRLWATRDWTLARTLTGHMGWVRALAFSPDSQTLASGGFDTTARLWRVADGALLQVLDGHSASVLAVAFAPDGATLATGSVDHTVRLWQVADGAPRAQFAGHADFVQAVAFAPDGATLASGAVDNTVRLWPLNAAALAGSTHLQAPPPSESCVECHHPQGSLLAPEQARPARVIDVACSTCHAGGPLVRNWDTSLPRAPGPTTMFVSDPATYGPLGLPHGSPTLDVVLATPGNGEVLYSGGEVLALVPVAGRVAYAGGAVTEVVVRLEVWSGQRLAGALTTHPLDSGVFAFNLSVNAGAAELQVPIDLRECLVCHDPNYESFRLGAYTLEGLPAGEVRLRVTATAPDGALAADDRWITVDESGVARLPVHTRVEGSDELAGRSLPVQAATRLYEWRGRTFSAPLGADGLAVLEVEALAEAATTYAVFVPPTVIEGRLYASVEPVAVTVPAGAVTVPPVDLVVRAELGQITGRLAGVGAGVPIHALHLPEGTGYVAHTASAGQFSFVDLPIGQYRLLADPPSLAGLGLASRPLVVDLSRHPHSQAALEAAVRSGPTAAGRVYDETGSPLPFAWVSHGVDGVPHAANLGAGAWSLEAAAEARSLVARAPGYYSQAIPWRTGEADTPAFTLAPRPDLRRVPWGEGAVVVPPETHLSGNDGAYSLETGWLWGQGGGEAVQVETGGVVLTIHAGQFALEQAPGVPGWFYLLEGRAEARRAGQPDDVVPLNAPVMLALTTSGALKPIPLDPVVLEALRSTPEPPPLVWETSLAARIGNALALLGISAAQVVTFVTYTTVPIALFMVPLVRVALWMRQVRRARKPTND